MATALLKIIFFADNRISKSLLKPRMLVSLKRDLRRQYSQNIQDTYLLSMIGPDRQMNLSFSKWKNHNYHHHNRSSQKVIRHLCWVRSTVSVVRSSLIYFWKNNLIYSLLWFYFWPPLVFVITHGPSLVAASRGYSLVAMPGHFIVAALLVVEYGAVESMDFSSCVSWTP